jgi:predicted Zn-dependent protease
VKVMQRRATIAVALTLGLVSAPALMAVFSSPDLPTGVQAANAVRQRITNSVPIRQLYVIPWEQIDQYLKSSGYKSDSALGPGDLKELAKLLRADEVIMGTITKLPTGVRIEARLARSNDVTQGQPLGSFDVTNPADAARPIERALQEARKQLVDVRACENGIRDQKLPVAIAAARAGILKFPTATIARLCLATAFQQMKQPDSSLKVVDEIKKLDPKNSFVHRIAYLAYKDKNDPEGALRALLELLRLEPTNLSLQQQVITELAQLGKPSVAIPIVDTLLAQNPGDPNMIRQKWLLSLAAAQAERDSTTRSMLLATAMQAGENMVRADTNMADSTYFARQLAASQASANYQKMVEYASRATQKFPNNAEFWVARATAERRAGQLQMAQQSLARILAIDPKYPNVTVLLAQTWVDMNMPDSAVAVARRAVAAGEDPKTWGPFLLGPVNAMFREAQKDKDIPKFRRVLTLAQESDRLSATPQSKFFIGVASYFIANDLLIEKAKPILDQAQNTKNARQKNQLYARACPLLRESADYTLLIQTNMPQGGSVEPTLAQQILGWAGSVTEYQTSATKVACK